MSDKKCVNCGKVLPRESTRRRKFCCDSCRVEYSRRNSVDALYSISMNAVYKLGRVPVNDKRKATEALKELKKAIDYELRSLGDADTLYKYELLQNRAD